MDFFCNYVCIQMGWRAGKIRPYIRYFVPEVSRCVNFLPAKVTLRKNLRARVAYMKFYL